MGVINYVKIGIREWYFFGKVVGDNARACGSEINIRPIRMKAATTAEIKAFHTIHEKQIYFLIKQMMLIKENVYL